METKCIWAIYISFEKKWTRLRADNEKRSKAVFLY
jgi:hypothetical protein